MTRRTYRSVLLGKASVAPGVLRADFRRPEGFVFEPGQHVLLSVETVQGLQEKPFTVASAPGEPDLSIATRLTPSAFKQALDALEPGGEIELTGPLGGRVLPPDTAKALFLVGGIGITPARSVLRDAALRGTGLDATVVYGNQDQSCVPFVEEFDRMAEVSPGTRFVHVLAAPLPGWEGETGFITADVVRRHAPDLDERHVVVCGPPAMVQAMDSVVSELGVPAERLTVERFSGYA